MGCGASLPDAADFLVEHSESKEYGEGLLAKEVITLKVKQKLFSIRGDFTVKDAENTP